MPADTEPARKDLTIPDISLYLTKRSYEQTKAKRTPGNSITKGGITMDPKKWIICTAAMLLSVTLTQNAEPTYRLIKRTDAPLYNHEFIRCEPFLPVYDFNAASTSSDTYY